MERERGGGDDEVEHEVDGEEVREEARREDVAEDLGQIEHGRVWHDRESERPKRMRSARPDRPGAGRAPAPSPAPSVLPKRNGYFLEDFFFFSAHCSLCDEWIFSFSSFFFSFF